MCSGFILLLICLVFVWGLLLGFDGYDCVASQIVVIPVDGGYISDCVASQVVIIPVDGGYIDDYVASQVIVIPVDGGYIDDYVASQVILIPVDGGYILIMSGRFDFCFVVSCWLCTLAWDRLLLVNVKHVWCCSEIKVDIIMVKQTCLPAHPRLTIFVRKSAGSTDVRAYLSKYEVSRKYRSHSMKECEFVASKVDCWALMELSFLDICIFQTISGAKVKSRSWLIKKVVFKPITMDVGIQRVREVGHFQIWRVWLWSCLWWVADL